MKKIMSALIVAFIFTITMQNFVSNVNHDFQNNIVRLHILANSNSKVDQQIKLKVRDEILKSVSLDDKNFIEKAEKTANKVLKSEKYGAKAEYGNFYFPLKKYKGIVMPCGYYNGVRIKLGEGKGENWWCMLYPPLCIQDGNVTLNNSAQKELENTLDSQSYEIITKKDDKIVVKFKTVELVNKIIHYFSVK